MPRQVRPDDGPLATEHLFEMAPDTREGLADRNGVRGRGRPAQGVHLQGVADGIEQGQADAIKRKHGTECLRHRFERGAELTEPSYLFEYNQIDKLPDAFELTFGEIQWRD